MRLFNYISKWTYRKGIVSEISSIISGHNANIETSKMIRLEKEFAMLILIEIQKDKKQTK